MNFTFKATDIHAKLCEAFTLRDRNHFSGLSSSVIPVNENENESSR